MTVATAIATRFESIVGVDGVRSWDALGAERSRFLSALSPSSEPACIVYPDSTEKLGAAIACARREHWPLLLCGRGSKLNWGGFAEGVRAIVSTANLDRVIEHAAGDLTLTVEAGVTFAKARSLLQSSRQRLGFDPAYAESATLGGIVATGDSGSLRQRYNSLRDMLLGIQFVRSDGLTSKAGGRVVKNVAGYDLMKLMTGAYGTLGCITELTFRLYPIPEASKTVMLTGEADAIASVTMALLNSSLDPAIVDLLSADIVRSLDLGSGLGVLVQFQNIPESVDIQAARLVAMGEAWGLSGTILADADELFALVRQQVGVASETDNPHASPIATSRAAWLSSLSGLI
ncbi:MAG: FAD-binding oxidoreductase [Cyanobacteria bacterium J06648_11]